MIHNNIIKEYERYIKDKKGGMVMNLENFEEKDMINMIYQAQEEKIDEILKNVDKKLKDQLEVIASERIIEDSYCAEQAKEILNKIEENYNIKITEYNKEIYKKGFMDGVNMLLNCLRK